MFRLISFISKERIQYEIIHKLILSLFGKKKKQLFYNISGDKHLKNQAAQPWVSTAVSECHWIYLTEFLISLI